MNMCEAATNEIGSSTSTKKLDDWKKYFIQEKAALAQQMEEEKELIDLATVNLETITSTLDTEMDKLNFNEVNKLIKQLETDKKKINGSAVIKETYSLANFAGCKCPATSFLHNIVHRILEGEIFFAVGFTSGKTRYGNISLSENGDKLFVHALTLYKVEKNSSVILFQDVKKCVKKDNFHPFMEIETRLIFTLTSSSSLAHQFVKLCTGETGPTFKGSCVKTTLTNKINSGKKTSTRSIKIDKYMLNNEEAEGLIDYNLSLLITEKNETYPAEEVVIKMQSNGSCSIEKYCESNSNGHVVAKLVNSQVDIFEGVKTGDEIKDCGISFLINK